MTSMPPQFHRISTILLGAVIYLILLLWLYLPALDVYFAVDDWVFLNYVSTIPVSQPWLYFNTTAIWFYRPLHLLQFGLTHHFVGLNATAYNAQLIVMVLLLLPLIWIFLRRLFNPAIATLATLLFSIPSFAPDILFWKSNFNTLHYAVLAIISCILWLRYLETRARQYYVASVIIAILGWFTRESCINIPLILACVELTWYLQIRWHQRPYPPALTSDYHPLRAAIQRLVLPLALAGTYIILHRLLFRNLDNIPRVTYTFVSPFQAIAQLLRVTTATLLDFIYDPLLLSRLPAIQGPLTRVVQHGYIIPPAIFLIGLWRKNPGIIFAVPFIISSHIPTFIVTNYNDTRYLYFGSLGYAIFIASLLAPLLSRFAAAWPVLRPRTLFPALAASILFLWIFIGNFSHTYNWLNKVAIESAFFQQACNVIKRDSPTLPPGTVLLVENASDRFMGHGTGAVEMIRVLTNRTDIIGMATQSQNDPTARTVLAGAAHIFKINVLTTQPKLEQVK